MERCFADKDITAVITTRINYSEILNGAAENQKLQARKFLKQFALLEFDNNSALTATKLAFKYRVNARNQRDFLVASVAITYKLPLLTENEKDFNYSEIKLLPYRLADL
jgi:predicted nucleic acid-binding protein